MNDPIKIIHKYKNNNRKIQYLCYIYLGEFIPDNVKKVLLKIDNIDFFESLNTLSTNEVKSLEEYYGDYWYEKLFISHHIIRGDYIRTPIGGFYNHSDNPNVVRVTENKICYLMTIRDIEAGEEITGKYNLYEVSNV